MSYAKAVAKANNLAMVKEINKQGKKYFECEECNFSYKDRKIAKECEDYCKKHHACSTEITEHAIKV